MKRREFIAGLGAAAWPVGARAQQLMPAVGYLSANIESASRATTAAFRQGLGEIGYVEGQNVELIYRWADAQYDRVPGLAGDLVRRGVAVIVATGGAGPALAAKSATATIPIVFAHGADPVLIGLVASFNRPGGNVTGVSFLTVALTAKRLELLREIVPAATSIGYLVNPAQTPIVEASMREAEIAARTLGVRLVVLNASASGDIELAFTTLVEQRIGAVLVDADPFLFAQSDHLAALAARHAVPAIYAFREAVEAGGLMTYGASLSDAYRLAGSYTGRILSGEKPAELPIQQYTKVEFIINLKTAKALGLTFPLNLLGRADEVIE